MLQVLNEMKTGKAPGTPDVSLELIAANGEAFNSEKCDVV